MHKVQQKRSSERSAVSFFTGNAANPANAAFLTGDKNAHAGSGAFKTCGFGQLAEFLVAFSKFAELELGSSWTSRLERSSSPLWGWIRDLRTAAFSEPDPSSRLPTFELQPYRPGSFLNGIDP